MLNAKKLVDLIYLMDARAILTQNEADPTEIQVQTKAELNYEEVLAKFGESTFKFIPQSETPHHIDLNITYNRDEEFTHTYLEGTLNYAVELMAYMICKHVFLTQPNINEFSVHITVEGSEVKLVSISELQNPERNLVPSDVLSLLDALAVNIPCYAYAHENPTEELKSDLAKVEIPDIGIARVDCILNTHLVEITPLKRTIIELFTKPEKAEAQPANVVQMPGTAPSDAAPIEEKQD